MASWVGDQDQVNSAKNAKTTPDITSPTENPKPKMEIKILNWNKKNSQIRRGFEQLSCFSGWQVMVRNASAIIVTGGGD